MTRNQLKFFLVVYALLESGFLLLIVANVYIGQYALALWFTGCGAYNSYNLERMRKYL